MVNDALFPLFERAGGYVVKRNTAQGAGKEGRYKLHTLLSETVERLATKSGVWDGAGAGWAGWCNGVGAMGFSRCDATLAHLVGKSVVVSVECKYGE